jgi:hypothetical protein
MAYFAVSIALLLVALLAGLAIGRRPRRLWAPVCTVIAIGIVLLGAGLYWEEYDAFFVYLWPDAVYFQTAKVMWLGFFLLGTGIGLYRQQAAGAATQESDRRATLRRNIRALLVFCLVSTAYLAYSFSWMLFRTNYTARDLPTDWDENHIGRQTTAWSCVAASLVTVLDRLGIPATQHEMARLALLRPGGGGSSVMTVRGLMLKVGDRYRVRLRRLDYDGLAAIPLPAEATVLWEKAIYHSVALLEWTPQGVVLGDPVRGLRNLTRQEFLDEWLGMVVTLEPRIEAIPGKKL